MIDQPYHYVFINEYFTEERARAYLTMRIEDWITRNPGYEIIHINWFNRRDGQIEDGHLSKAHMGYKLECELKGSKEAEEAMDKVYDDDYKKAMQFYKDAKKAAREKK